MDDLHFCKKLRLLGVLVFYKNDSKMNEYLKKKRQGSLMTKKIKVIFF